MNDDLVFTKRNPKKKYQVRFWAIPDLYKQFVAKIELKGLIIQDVFNDFMLWFVEKYK